jgi:hypothetical protein
MCRLIGKHAFIIALLALAPAAHAAAKENCYDLRKSEPHQLTGVLSYRIFPGPPNYADVQKGDTPEPAYVLTLPAASCLQGDDNADPKKSFNEVQLAGTQATNGEFSALREKEVTVTLERPISAQTGHQHLPLVAWVTDIAPATDAKAEYGTPATTVRAYYMALEAGDGKVAASFVVPEKRNGGPFSASDLSAFYGNLIEPLKLIAITPAGNDRFMVSYSFKSTERVCDGRAEVTTAKRNGADFIKAIRALNGC